MARVLGSIAAQTTASQYNKNLLVWFQGLGAAGADLAYTDGDKAITVTVNIDALPVTILFQRGVGISFSKLGQNEQTAFDDTTLSIANVDNFWSSLILNAAVRETRVQVWEVWKDPTTLAQVGNIQLFDGKINDSKFDEKQCTFTLVPNQTPWALKLPGQIFASNCGLIYKGEMCQYGLAPPASPAAVSAAGTLAAGTYWYRITATDAYGETLPSAYAATLLTAGHGVAVTWSAVTGATGYRVYGRLPFYEQYIAATGAGVLTYTDSGSNTPLGLPPKGNTTGALVSCDRSYTACLAHANTQHFRGFRLLPDPNNAIVFNAGSTKLPTRGY